MRTLRYLLCLLTVCGWLEGIEKLNPQYTIRYGNEESPIKVVEYFSFQCPHCVKLFKSDFFQIKESFIDVEKIAFEFHPVPIDLPTVQAMVCLSLLEDHQKKLFLEVLLDEAVPEDPELMAKMMMTAMEVFQKTTPRLDDPEFLRKSKAYQDAYFFLKQEEKILAVPTVEVNGKMFSDIPDYKFIQSQVMQ